MVKVFAAAGAPINWNLIEDFNFDDKNCRALLKNNKHILTGNLVKDQKTSYAYKTPIFKYLDLYISRKRNVFCLTVRCAREKPSKRLDQTQER